MFDFYTDAGLTNKLPSPLVMAHDISGSSDQQVYCGETGKTFQANSNPGVDQITVSIGGGGAQGVSSVTLAATQAGLDTATPGAPLDLGLEITGSAVFWIRQTDIVGVAGDYAGASISVNELQVA